MGNEVIRLNELDPEEVAAEEYERELGVSNDLWREDREDLVFKAFLAGVKWERKEAKK